MAQSSDPDADAFMGSFDHPEAEHDSDAATFLASFDKPTSGYHPKSGSEPVVKGDQPELLPMLWEGGKEVAKGIVHGAGTLADVATGTDPGAGSHAERWASAIDTDPSMGGQISDKPAIGPEVISSTYDKSFGTGPAAQTFKERIPQAIEAIGTAVPTIKMGGGIVGKIASRAPVIDAQSALNAAAANSPQSMGAAASAPNLQATSTGLQQAVQRTVQKTGGAINPETFARHAEADSLPVKIQLTPGQASQDPALISTEKNNRGRTPGLPDLLNEQNKRLGQNIQALRDEVGPDVFSTDHVQHADTLIQSYKDKGALADTDTSAKYQALKDANGGQFPVDAPKLLDNATSALHKELLFDHAPKAVMSTLGRLADSNNMTFENYESLRTNLARIQRSLTADGNEKAAAGIIRSSMEDLPLQPGAAKLKPLADIARSAAKAQFDAVKADPAYKAAINDEVPADKFIQKYVIGGTRDNVALMKQNLLHDPVATQTMGVAALDHLRGAAGLDAQGNGIFKQSGFNKAQQSLAPKLNSLVNPKIAESLEKVGNVARYTQAQPEGSFVNNSNTLVGALAEHGATAAENLINAKTGIGGTLIRKAVQFRGERKAAQEVMKPYGGLERLSDVAKP